jgi:hypothetical protein
MPDSRGECLRKDYQLCICPCGLLYQLHCTHDRGAAIQETGRLLNNGDFCHGVETLSREMQMWQQIQDTVLFKARV